MSSTAMEQPPNCETHLHAANVEIESLKQALHEKQSQLVAMETACLRESDRQVELEDSVIAWQDKYDRLYESHKRVQKVNQSLEDKLLKLVDRNTGERAQLTSDVATLSVRLAQANFNIAKLQREIERYKADINLAIQLLQCKPESFMPQKVSSLPIDIQSKVSAYMRLETNSHSDSEGSTSGVGVSTTASYKVLPASDSPPPAPCPFPPTAMVYSMRGLDAKPATDTDATLNHNNNNNVTSNNNNNLKEPTQTNTNNNNATTCHPTASLNVGNVSVSASSAAVSTASTCLSNANVNGLDPELISPIVMAKFLEDELKAGEVKHCDTCQCSKQDLTVLADVSRSYTVATQTPFQHLSGSGSGTLNEPLAQLCLRCHSNLNSPSRTNSPYLMKLVKSSDSVISETKSSVSDLNDLDKLFTPAKKDDLMVNPILGHHRLCDRTSGSGALALALAAQQQQQQQQQQNGGKLNATMLYPTTHLGAYAAEKYLLETSSLAALGGGGSVIGQLKNGYQRRFLDGGGTALELLNGSNTPKKGSKLLELNGNDDGEDEAKPLLSGVLHTNLLDVEKLKNGAEAVERALGASGAAEQQVKSPASTCSAANAKPQLMKSAITGSVNSLWSKTSSCEGAKMFENFNRNLIKTIKAENPKYRGPRLCAMRIQQNGQSNILLDNIESIEAVTPIIYKRRERLLDEELDDTKDIITSKSTMTPAAPRNELVTATADVKLVDAVSIKAEAWAKNATTESNAECNVAVVVANCAKDAGGSGDGGSEEVTAVAAATELHTSVNGDTNTEQKTASTELDTNGGVQLNAATEGAAAPAVPELSSNATINLLDLQTTLPVAALGKHSPSYEILRNESSSKNSLNSKSCTQSSSISDVIDFQESVILRRQQLSRVAEWVQNNTQQLEQQQQQQQQQQVMSALNNCDSSGTDRQSSFSTLDQLDSVSMEKLSMDSGYKTTPQPQTNGYQADDANKSTEDSLSPKTDTNSSHNNNKSNNNNNNNLPYNHYNHQHSQPLVPLQQHHQQQQPITNTYYRRTTRSGLPVAYTTPDPNAENGYCYSNNNNGTTPTSPEQPTCDILNYKYYPSDTDKTRAIKAELHTTTQSVDIAQMEYNVKQFLLKQNEWSMRCSARSGTKGTNTTTTSSNLSSVASQATFSQKAAQAAPKLLRHTKLFSGAGVGPGVGERVRNTIVLAGAAAQAAAEGSAAADAITNVVQQAAVLPQRTETNL